jgi:hypothetical protein
VAFSFREEGSLPPVLSPEGACDVRSFARMGSVGIRRFPTGLHGTSLELGLRQCSFHHTMQVLRTYDCLRLFFVFRFSAMLCSPLPFDVR